jgi:hypothetical protein
MVDGVFSRAFKTGVRPVELGRRIVREMDEHRSVDVHGRRIVPNQFAFFLSPTDLANFAGIQDALITELVESAHDYAAQEGYYFMGPVTVDFVERSNVRTGRFQIVSQMQQDVGGGYEASYQPEQAPADPYGTGYAADYSTDFSTDFPDDGWGTTADPSYAPPVEESPWAPVGRGSDVTPPPVARPEPRPAPRAQPHLTLDNGEQVALGAEPAIIGRLAGCAVVVSDLNVSRKHAQVRRQGGVFVVSDLGSTNGTLVNGVRIDGERVLQVGDVISVGATHMRYEVS